MTNIELVKTYGVARSPKWPAVRKRFLKDKACAVCRGTKKLEAHHVKPFHLFPALELDPDNLLALCESGKPANCHLLFGHLGDFGSINKDARADAFTMRRKMEARP